jgi:membrane associated rhomboid family serine protease
MPWSEMIATIAIAAGLVLAFIAVVRLFATIVTHRTLRKAIETQPELAEGLLQKLTARRESSGDDKLAIILVAIGVAMVAAPIIAIDDPGIVRFAIGAALFPLLVGGALWMRSRAAERAKRREPAE